MSMFCYQCQEAMGGIGCNKVGMCGKDAPTAAIQDLLIYALKGLAAYSSQARALGLVDYDTDRMIVDGLFSTITNANFDAEALKNRIEKILSKRDALKAVLEAEDQLEVRQYHDSATMSLSRDQFDVKAVSPEVGVLATTHEDVRSLRELIIYGLKGLAAYAEHAMNLGKEDPEIFSFVERALLATQDDTMSADALVALTLETGKFGVDVMALLDKANTEAYGNPEITEVNIGVSNKPAILISGHDLKDMEELLKQTEGTGVDVYTHSEMLPANYYPTFKKYDHLI